MPPAAVTVAVANAANVPVYLNEIGKAVASESVTIQPQITGKILHRDFVDGADLKVGQKLFEIDPAPFLAALHQAQGQLEKDTAMSKNASSVVKRDAEAMANSKYSLSQTQVDSDQASADEAVAAITSDKAAIEAANVNLQYCTITSPINGRAGARMMDEGNVVTAAGQGTGTSLLTIQNLDPIYVDFTVTEQDLPRVRECMSKGTLRVLASLPDDRSSAQPSTQPAGAVGQSEGLDFDDTSAAAGPSTMPAAAGTPASNRPHVGKLIFLDNLVQDGSGTIRLRGEFKNADGYFWPGQFVNVRLILERKMGAVMVPVAATQISQQGLFVYKVINTPKSPTNPNGVIASMQPVQLGQRHGDMVVVESGLSPGDNVVSSGFTMLQPGAPIMVIPMGPPGGAPGGPPGSPAGGKPAGDPAKPAAEDKAGGPQSSSGMSNDPQGGRL